MVSAHGLVACNGGRVVGSFDVGGSRRYIDVDVKPSNHSFECSDATLTYDNVAPIAAIPQICELNIGHFLVGEAIFVGLGEAVRQMRAAMDSAR